MSEQEPYNPEPLIKFIAQTVEAMRDRMATKDDVAPLREQMATKDDLARLREQMATKDDLARLRERLDAGLAAVRGDIERVAVRVETLDSSVSLRFTAVEAAVSRVRSVVYLLVKDQPDLVRLLGSEPAHS